MVYYAQVPVSVKGVIMKSWADTTSQTTGAHFVAELSTGRMVKVYAFWHVHW